MTGGTAVGFIQSLPHTSSGGRLIVDSSGGAVVIEVSGDGLENCQPEDGLLILTNHAVCPALAGKDRHGEEYADSRARYSRLHNVLHGEERIGVEAMKKAMADHGAGVCRHKVDSRGRRDSTI